MLLDSFHNVALRTKIVVFISSVVLLAFISYTTWMTQRQKELVLDHSQVQIETVVRDFVIHHLTPKYQLLERNGLQSISAYADRYQREAFVEVEKQLGDKGGIILWADSRGEVLFSSITDTEKFKPLIGTVLQHKNVANQKNILSRNDAELNYLYGHAYFEPWGLHTLYLLDRKELTRSLEADRRLFLAVAIGIALLAGFFLFGLLNYFVIRRLTMLAGGIQSIIGGDFSKRIHLGCQDEIGKLANAFDTMTEKLQQTTAAKDVINHQLKNANQELEAFAYSVSHDLRAPLRSVDGFSQALIEDYYDKLDADARKYLEYLRQGAQEMGTLIDDLLTLSRSTRGDLEIQETDLSEIASAVVNQLRKREPERIVDCDIQPNIIAWCDQRLFKVVLENLLNNAWKYTSKVSEAKISLHLSKEEASSIEIYIKDNGAGFNNLYADKLFEPFQRLHRKDEFPGSGIGLSTVQRIIHRHGGMVRGEGQVGVGAAFYITIPKEQNSHV